jgi:hypothetical protein
MHAIVGPAKLKSAGQCSSWRLKEELLLQLKTQHNLEAEFPFLSGILVLSIWPSILWVRPANIMDGGLLFSKSTGLNVNHF